MENTKSSTFAEAWDLLLSEPAIPSNQLRLQTNLPGSPYLSKLSLNTPHDTKFPSRAASRPVSRQQPSASSSSGTESQRSRTTSLSTASSRSTHDGQNSSRAATTARTQQAASQARGSPQEPTPDVSRLLQSIRSDLTSLQSSGSSSPRDDRDTHTVSVLNQKFERLTDAVVSTQSTNSSASSPGRTSGRSSIDGPSPSSSTKDDTELRCWDSCCNGRKFSNRSNIIRHQRERSGEMGKLRCSFCNACFSRSSARNAHEAKRICRTQRSSHSY